MSSYRLTRQAARDLDQIADDVGRLSPVAARRLIAKIQQKCADYARMPGIGILRDDIEAGLRCFRVGAYLVFYRTLPAGIEIARVLPGNRDVRPSMFTP
jgi:toxin ParE1/3/4